MQHNLNQCNQKPSTYVHTCISVKKIFVQIDDMGGRMQIFVLIPEVVQFGNIIDGAVIDGAKGVHFPSY